MDLILPNIVCILIPNIQLLLITVQTKARQPEVIWKLSDVTRHRPQVTAAKTDCLPSMLKLQKRENEQ